MPISNFESSGPPYYLEQNLVSRLHPVPLMALKVVFPVSDASSSTRSTSSARSFLLVGIIVAGSDAALVLRTNDT